MKRRKAQPEKTQTTQPEIIRIGKDEMNLVEYPFALLRHESQPDAIIEQRWEAEHPITGRPVKALWQVTGDPVLGLPTASDEKVYLVLMELTREAGFTQEVYFTRYEIFKRLGWPDNQPHYRRLLEALRRLTAVTITSENAFWSPKAKMFYNSGFHILESYHIANERPGRKKKDAVELPLSRFRWSKEMLESFQHGYIRSIDLNLALTLNLPIALRLYRYLDKKKHDGKRSFEIELRRLCEIHLGMTTAKHMSTLKVRLQPAHDELIARGFLQSATYHPMRTRKGEKVCYTFPGPKSLPAPANKEGQAAKPAPPEKVNSGSLFDASVTPEEKSEEKPQRGRPKKQTVQPASEQATTEEISPLLQRVLDSGVSPTVAQEIFASFPHDQIALQLDCLPDREPKNPPAILVTAIRQGWAPPPKYLERLEAAEGEQKAREAAEAGKRAKAAQEAVAREETARLEEEGKQLDAMFEKLDERTRKRVDEQAIEKLGILGRSGRAQAALVAMRRTVLREMLGKAVTQEA